MLQRIQLFIFGMLTLFAIIVLVSYVISIHEGVPSGFLTGEGFVATSSIYDHPTRCFDCEVDAMRRLGAEYGWLGQPAKSYDSEKHMIRMTGDVASAIDTHPIRYYEVLKSA